MPEIKTITAACKFLENEKFKARTSTVHRHFQKGMFGKSKDGTFEEKVLLEYARVHLDKADTGRRQEQEDLDLARKLKEAELEKRQEQTRYAELKRLQLEKKVVPRGLYEKDLAARMAFFSAQLDALFPRLASRCVQLFIGEDHGRAVQLIEMVDGDIEKAMALIGFVEKMLPELISVFQVGKDRWLEAFARDRIHVVELEDYLEDGEDNVQI